ncbi:hypothetical protein QR680_006774 [Steinernema hermaphroditum]|uniref:Uncharacterized protein n=1 Tax=Steinernema hermaphroditum TaxID=289476 RepID=A0AA39HWJ0_9BILA|nr:hypothetical protein QR680_006774 [Steinernema hermaphroditum]
MKATLALLLSIALLLSLTSAFQLDQAFPFRRIRTRGQAGGYRDLPPYPACFSLYRNADPETWVVRQPPSGGKELQTLLIEESAASSSG